MTTKEIKLTDSQKTALSIARDHKFVQQGKYVYAVGHLGTGTGALVVKTAPFNKLKEYGLVEEVETPEEYKVSGEGSTFYKVTGKGYEAYVFQNGSTASDRWLMLKILMRANQVTDEQALEYIERIISEYGFNQSTPNWTAPKWMEEMYAKKRELNVIEEISVDSEDEFDPKYAKRQLGLTSSRPYENLTARQKLAVDDAWTAVQRTFRGLEFKAANNDHAEYLVDAITAYLLESNK